MEYLLKSSACLISFYVLYFFIFRKFTFHTANRFYLIFSLVLSILLPFLTNTKTEIEYLNPSVISTQSLIEYPQPIFQSTASDSVISTNTDDSLWSKIEIIDILEIAYLLGLIISILLFFKNILFVINTLKRERYDIVHQNIKIYRTGGFLQNSSFLNNIFINNKLLNPHEESLIIKHESLHFRKLHSLDLLFVGFAKCFFWFNPVIHFFQKSLKEIHEYEVDDLMIKDTDTREYALLLLKLGVKENHAVLNQMSKKPLSKRIEFLFKGGTSNTKKYTYLITLPLLVFSLFAFTNEEVVKVYKEIDSGEKITKIEVKSYPLILKKERNYATWGSTKALKMLPSNLTLNNLTTVNFNGYRYEVNPISLTERTVEAVNAEIKKRNLALVISEKELDINGNYKKLKLAVKHLKTGQSTAPEYFDMNKCRDQGENGAFFVIEAYDRNFEKSQISYFFGSPNLLINKSHLERSKHNTFNLNSESSIISHSSDLITYVVYPDKLSLKAAQEAKAYFSENGLKFELKDYELDAAGNLSKVKIEFGDQSRTFELDKMRHWLKLKSEANSKPQRMDASMVFEGNLKTKETKILVNDFWFRAMEKSGKYEILSKPELKTLKATSYNYDTLRTVPATNKLGKNPLVIINMVEYPSEILKRINPERIRGYYFTPPNNPNALKKYGDKARDGVFETESIGDDFILSDKGEFDRIQMNTKTQINADKKRVVRLILKNNKGENYQHVVLNRPDKETSQFGIDVPLKNRIVFIVNDEIVSEEYIENCNLNFVRGSCGEGFSYFDFKKYGEHFRNYDGYFIVYTEKN